MHVGQEVLLQLRVSAMFSGYQELARRSSAVCSRLGPARSIHRSLANCSCTGHLSGTAQRCPWSALFVHGWVHQLAFIGARPNAATKGTSEGPLADADSQIA